MRDASHHKSKATATSIHKPELWDVIAVDDRKVITVIASSLGPLAAAYEERKQLTKVGNFPTPKLIVTVEHGRYKDGERYGATCEEV